MIESLLFNAQLMLTAFLKCSSLPEELNLRSTCLNLEQSLVKYLGLFFAVIAIIFVIAEIGLPIAAGILVNNITFSLIGIGISILMEIDSSYDIILLILSIVFWESKLVKPFLSLLIILFNLNKALVILQN